ncbi:hypothetical protein BGX21_009732 [Mortierella sp. AD011]|nr:hypothetical protein BGX20_006788 [Mortierella sp. AD010]KAF9395918.1 hypothetical protein BGX21_009732 [Mortierella sp. AD011]
MTRLFALLSLGAILQIAVYGAPIVNNDVCDTHECRLVAAEILKDMNPSADPCVDFSQFTCGNLYEKAVIPDYSISAGTLESLEDHVNNLIRAIATPGNPRLPKFTGDETVNKRNLGKIQNYYASCMDEAQQDKAGREPLLNQIQNLIELFSVQDSDLVKHSSKKSVILSETDRRSLSTVIGQYINNGIDTVFDFSIDTAPTDPDHYYVSVEGSGFGLPDSSAYNDTQTVAPYEKMIGEMFTLILGSSRTITGTIHVPKNWAQVAKNVVAFETSLSQITAESYENYSEKSIRIHPVADLAERTPSLDWSIIFGNAFPQDVKAPSDVYVIALDYFDKLNTLLENTSPKTLQNYFAWTLMRTYGSNLGQAYRKPLDDFAALFQVTPSLPDLSSQCVGIVSDKLGDLVGHYFVEAAFPKATIAKIHEIVVSLREAYAENFKIYDWFDSYTRKGALEKIKAIIENDGYSMGTPNDGILSSINAYYGTLTVLPDDFFGNQVKSLSFSTQNQFRLLNTVVNRKSMAFTPQTVNAYYQPTMNDINILAGITQSPLFHIGNPEYLNYGAIGMVVGHEIGHGFDNNGRNYDATGRLRNWWSNSSANAFEVKTQCLVEEYSNFTIKGPDSQILHVDGQNTLPENIADNGGIKMAYEAWSARYRSDPNSLRYNNKKLPGFESFTPEQLFFIQYGHTWCSKLRPEAADIILQDVHSPTQWRINGVARNSEFFARAFKCKPNAPMNPVNKCSVL